MQQYAIFKHLVPYPTFHNDFICTYTRNLSVLYKWRSSVLKFIESLYSLLFLKIFFLQGLKDSFSMEDCCTNSNNFRFFLSGI